MSFNRLQTLSSKSLASHIADAVSHITAAERTSWNAKLDASEFTGHSHDKLVKGGFNLNAPTLTEDSTISLDGHNHEIADIIGLSEKLVAVLRWKGSCTYAELIAKTGQEAGDVWCVTDKDYTEYAWSGAAWEPLGINVDMTLYVKKLTTATTGNFVMFAAGGDIADNSYVPLSSYSASGSSNKNIVTEAALQGGLATKMNLVAAADADKVLIADSDGDSKASDFKIGATDKTSFGSATELAVESAVKDWVESIVPVVPEVIGKMDKVTTFTAGHVVSLVADSQATPQGNAADSGFGIGATDKTDFGASDELAVESAVKDYADTEIAKKMAKVASTDAGEFIVASSAGDAEASGYTLGVTTASSFGTANKIATEAGSKAYADSIKPDISQKMNFAAAADADEILIVDSDGDAKASNVKIGASDTADFGSTSEVAMESAVKSYADGKMTKVAAADADELIIASSTGDAAASSYSIGVTVATNFGAANKVATEEGAKAYADQEVAKKMAKVDSSDSGEVIIASSTGDAAASNFKIGGTDTTSFGSSSELAVESAAKAYADSLVKTHHTASIADSTVAAADLEAALIAGGMQHQIACTAAATINLPTTAGTFAGRSANVDIVINKGTYSVTVVAGSVSEVFTADADTILLLSFKSVKTGANTFEWRLSE